MVIIILVLIVGTGAFFGGIQYQKRQRPGLEFNGQGGQWPSRRLGNGQNGNTRPVSGQIINSEDKSITVKMQDGSSKIVFVSDNTSITEATAASKQSLQTGKQIMMFGTGNSDGSITAQNIQLNTQFRGAMVGTPR